MARSDKFFHFPIKAIRLNKAFNEVADDELRDRLNDIISWCLFDVAAKERLKHEDQEFTNIAFQKLECDYPQWSEENETLKPSQISLLVGASILGVTLGGLDWKFQRDRASSIDTMAGGKTMCRIKSDLLFDVRDNQCLTWREFSLLCAVYAGIGSQQRKRLSFNQLSAMSLGYTGPTEFNKVVTSKVASKRRLSDRQVGYTIDALRRRGFFVKLNVNGRHNWYSNRLSEASLAELLVEGEVKKQQLSDRQKTEALQAEIQRMIREQAGVPEQAAM